MTAKPDWMPGPPRRMLSVDPDDLHKKGRADDLSSAKGLICCLGYYQLGINGEELARYFGISRPSVSQAIKRGESLQKRMMLNY
jgi:DNA-binding MarR family transcriptional regulator